MKGSEHYVLSVLITDTGETMTFASDTPFQAISKGDTLETSGWDEMGDLKGTPLLVLGVNHVIFEIEGKKPTHQVRLVVRPLTSKERADMWQEPSGGRGQLWDDPVEEALRKERES